MPPKSPPGYVSVQWRTQKNILGGVHFFQSYSHGFVLVVNSSGTSMISYQIRASEILRKNFKIKIIFHM